MPSKFINVINVINVHLPRQVHQTLQFASPIRTVTNAHQFYVLFKAILTQFINVAILCESGGTPNSTFFMNLHYSSPASSHLINFSTIQRFQQLPTVCSSLTASTSTNFIKVRQLHIFSFVSSNFTKFIQYHQTQHVQLCHEYHLTPLISSNALTFINVHQFSPMFTKCVELRQFRHMSCHAMNLMTSFGVSGTWAT